MFGMAPVPGPSTASCFCCCMDCRGGRDVIKPTSTFRKVMLVVAVVGLCTVEVVRPDGEKIVAVVDLENIASCFCCHHHRAGCDGNDDCGRCAHYDANASSLRPCPDTEAEYN